MSDNDFKQLVIEKFAILEQGQAKLEQGLAKLEQGQAKLEADIAVIKRQQKIDSDSIDNIYKLVNRLRDDYDSHEHDTNKPKVAVV